ncbi:MAG: hypothetical protein ACRCTA_03100 [Bacilli bacterium]
MAKYKNKNNPYKQKRQAKAKPVSNEVTSKTTKDLQKQLDGGKHNKLIIGIVIVVVVLLVGSMFSQALLAPPTKNFKPNFSLTNKDDVKPVFNATSISFGQSLNRSEEKYYVVFGVPNEIAAITSMTNAIPTYTVDSTLPINAQLTSDVKEAQALPTTLDEIKLSDTMALLYVENGKIVSYVQGQSNIESSLNQ